MDILTIQWILLVLFGLGFFALAPLSKRAEAFFAAETETGEQPGFLMLTASLVISWIFAKSITNAANLGLDFGLVGGVAYGVYYFSFLIAGLIIYQLRTKGGFESIHQFLSSKYGQGAVMLFSLLIGIRLFNEVWSNSMVIGSYFGATGSAAYYTAILVFTALTLAYVAKGGLRSALISDAIQMLFFAVLLVLLLGIILPSGDEGISDYMESGTWSMDMGLNLFFAALLQCFSYPFHDPVLTDRAFISSPKITLKSFFWASIIGFFCIVLFSLVGVFAQFQGLEGQAAVKVGQLLGVVVMLAMNFIMVTSAASTLDSTFSSFAKMIVVDLGLLKAKTVQNGRLMMVLIAVAGTLPVFMNPEILSATTVSGTMVMGLAPVFVCWNWDAPKLSFQLSVWIGILVGTVLAFGAFPEAFIYTQGKYAALLWANIWGLCACFLGFFIPFWLKHD